MPVSSSMRLTLALVSLALAAVPARLLAQAQATTGVIRGTVTDSAGAPLAGASVTLRNAETNAERVLTTNDHQQALDRIGGSHGHAGERAAEAAVEMIALLATIKGASIIPPTRFIAPWSVLWPVQ